MEPVGSVLPPLGPKERPIQIGAIFPQTEIGTDPAAVRDWAQAVEDLGYSHILAFDHVLGANPDRSDRRERRWPYTHESVFWEPFALFAYLAGVTRRAGLSTGIVILPQRQTVLAAKQAAVVDVLSGGRLRLGVGLGWNEVEYEALGENFHNRGRRVEEQVAVLRALWTQELVTFEGRWHRIVDAGINPLPVQRPIPIWMGGSAEPALRRLARLADGWLPNVRGRPRDEWMSQLDLVRRFASEAGRDPASLGVDSFLPVDGSPEQWRRDLDFWTEAGASHVSVNTMRLGLAGAGPHIAKLRQVARDLGVAATAPSAG